MAQSNQVVNLLTVMPLTLMLYDYAITLDNEIKYIWNRSMSIVNLIYFTLRYVGTIFALYYTGALLWDWNTSNEIQVYSFTLRLLQIWPLSIGTWLVHVVLQMRVYILHNRSRRVLFIVVLGFIIEVAVSLVTMIRVSIFQANNAVNQTATVLATFPASETIDIYVNAAALLLYEFLLFSLALWAAVQCSRRSLAENQIGARNLRIILIEGNVMYFLVCLLTWSCRLLCLIRPSMSQQMLHVPCLPFSVVRSSCISGVQPHNHLQGLAVRIPPNMTQEDKTILS
ncbi:hypothetical protein J3A83DRAFT_2934348 [Scleroderma citrinum]